MSFGLEFTNNSNVVTLDSVNARLVTLFSGQYTANSGGGLASVVSFPNPVTTQEPPLIFLRPTTNSARVAAIAMVTIVGSPGNWTGFTLRTRNVNYAQPNGKWFAAAFQPRAEASYGLRLWGEDAGLLFDSATPCAVFTRAFQTWTYVRTEQLDIGSTNIFRVTGPSAISEDEYLMVNNFAMNMCAGNNPGRTLTSMWNFSTNELYVGTTSTANPVFMYLPALFAKMTA